MESTRSWLASRFNYPELLSGSAAEATPHEQRIVAYTTRIIGRVVLASTGLFAFASGADGLNFHGTWATFPVRMLGVLALFLSTLGWYDARRRGRVVPTGIMGAHIRTRNGSGSRSGSAGSLS